MALSPEELEGICDRLAEGESLRSICRSMGLAESSVRRWLAKDEAAMAHSAHARELGCDALADDCLRIADDETLDPAHKRIMVDTRIRLIGKWSQRYSDKVTVKSESTVTHKHDLDRLSTGELEQLEAILAKSERGPGDTGEAVASSLH